MSSGLGAFLLLCALSISGSEGGGSRRRSATISVQSAGQLADFDCPEEFGYYPHQSDCTQYYVCVFGSALLESCTGGLQYSHELQTCDWPRNVGCSAGEQAVVQASSRGREQAQVQQAREEIRVSRVQQPQVIVQQQQPVQQQVIRQRQQQQHIPKHDLYTEEEELGPVAEEVETDRQQRVYRGQPSTIGQVQSDRDAISTHSNAIPVSSTGRENSKLSVVSYGAQQQYNSFDSLTDSVKLRLDNSDHNFLTNPSHSRKKRQTLLSSYHQEQRNKYYKYGPYSAPRPKPRYQQTSHSSNYRYDSKKKIPPVHYKFTSADAQLGSPPLTYDPYKYVQLTSGYHQGTTPGNYRTTTVRTELKTNPFGTNLTTSDHYNINNLAVGGSVTKAAYFTTIRPTTVPPDEYEDDYDYYDDPDEDDLETSTKSYNLSTKSLPYLPRDQHEPPLEYFKTNNGKQLKNPYANNFDFDKFLTELREQVYGKSSTIAQLVTTAKSVQQTPKMYKVEGLTIPAKSAALKPTAINNKNLQSYLKYKMTQNGGANKGNIMSESESYEDEDYYDEEDYEDYEDTNSTGIAVSNPHHQGVDLVSKNKYKVKEEEEDYDSEEYEDSEEYDEEDTTEKDITTTTPSTPTTTTTEVIRPTVRSKFKKVTRPSNLRYPMLNLTKATTEKGLPGDCSNHRRSYRLRGKNRCTDGSTEDNHDKTVTIKSTTVKDMIDLTLKQLRGGRILSKTTPMAITTEKSMAETTITSSTLEQATTRNEILSTQPMRQSTKLDLAVGKTLKTTLSNQIPGSTTERLKVIRVSVSSATPNPNPTSPSLRQRQRPLKDSAKDFLSKAYTQRALTQMRASLGQTYEGSTSAAPVRSYNSTQYISQYDPYYQQYEDQNIYKDIEYAVEGQEYRRDKKPQVEIVEQDRYNTKYTNQQENIYQPVITQHYNTYTEQVTEEGDYRQKPYTNRGNSRNRGTTTYTYNQNEAEPASQQVNRGTPAVSRSRPTLKPSTAIVSKAAEFVDVYRFPPKRPESIYPTPTPDKTAAKCRKDVCLLPDCYCGGKDVPGDIPVEQTPQIVLLTFDDSVNDLNKGLYSDLFEKGRTNPNGCPISATFYVSHEWTDYSQVQNLYSAGHEIASHSVSHSFGEQFSQKKWTREIGGQREILAAYGGVKLEDIRGMRAPFLAVGGNKMFKMLYDSNFTYDSSMPVYENRPPSWPYTMDYKIFHDCMIPPCPTKSYPGVWEVPMVMWQDLNGGRCSMGDACSNPPASDGVYKMLIKNFERHFTSNRAPFGLFYHAAWFTQPHHKEGFIAFLDTITQMPEVWLVTNWQLIQWMRDPTPISRLNSFQPFQCNYQDRPKKCTNPKVCNLWHKSGVRYMRTCQACPDVYPWTGKTGIRNSRVDNESLQE